MKVKSQSTYSRTDVHRTVLPMNIVTPLQFEEQCQSSTMIDQWHRTWTLARQRFSKLAPGRFGRWGPGFQWRVGSGMCRQARCLGRWGRAGQEGCHRCALLWTGSYRSLVDTSAPLLQSNQPEIQRESNWKSQITIKLSLKITTFPVLKALQKYWWQMILVLGILYFWLNLYP